MSIICLRFLPQNSVSGARVVDQGTFIAASFKGIEEYIREKEPEYGYGFIPKFWMIPLPEMVLPYVTTGVGLRSKDFDDYIALLDEHGCPKLFLDRKFALPAKKCFARVFRVEEYVKDGYLRFQEQVPQFPPHVTHIVAEIIIEDGSWEYKTMMGLGESLPRPSSLSEFLTLKGLWNQKTSSDAQSEAIARVQYWEEYWSKYAEVAG